ncbi:MAG: hypothetical protein ACJAYG_002747 [Oceanicoccus sp.]|jgi:hypothetical protein
MSDCNNSRLTSNQFETSLALKMAGQIRSHQKRRKLKVQRNRSRRR